MQTFLPYRSFEKSAEVLDYKRLGKQRVEAYQMLRALRGETEGWVNHPATRMWEGHMNALKEYYNAMLKEWISRGYKNTMKPERVRGKVRYPWWLGKRWFHDQYKALLLRKDPVWYGQFGWNVGPETKTFLWPTAERGEFSNI
jgi:hypothetical protein